MNGKKSHISVIRLIKSSKGQALVEFAFVLPILFGFIFGIIEFGRVMWVQQVLSNAARAAVREASLSGAKVTNTVNTNYIINPLAASRITVTSADIAWTPDVAAATANNSIGVVITVPFSRVTLSKIVKVFGVDLSGVSLKGQCTMRKEE